MFVAYLLIVTMNSGASELVDPELHLTTESCQLELETMRALASRDLASHNIIAMHGSCRTDIVELIGSRGIQAAEIADN